MKNLFFKKFLIFSVIIFFGILFFVKISLADAIPVFYSVGQNTSDHKTGSPTITITGTANATSTWQATFSQPQTARNLGVGDVITYGNTGTAYISGKITTMQWNVITATGTQVAATTTATVNSIAHAFSSLEGTVDANTATGAFDSSHLNTKDLTAKGYVVNIPCYYDTGADTAQVTVQSWTTSATSYIRIYTPTNTSTEVNQSQRHNGKWDTGKWRIQISNANIIEIDVNYIRLDGLQFKLTAPSNNSNRAVFINTVTAGNNEIWISNSVIQAVLSGTANSNYGILTSSNSNITKIWNNLFYGFGIYSDNMVIDSIGGTTYAYNNTMYGSDYGINQTGGTTIAKNNISYKNTNCYAGTFDTSSTNNLSSDSTAPAYGTYYRSATVRFVNSSKYDYHLDYNDTAAKGYGKNLSNDANLAITTDIDGQTRPSATSSGMWDIGADQTEKSVRIISTPPPANQNFGSAIPVFYSVGQNTTDHKTGSPTITITGTANATSTWQATFSQPQTARNLGVGDVITYGNTGTAYISGKITTMQWNVITATGTQVAATSSSPVNSVAHAFASLNAAVSGASPGAIGSSYLNTADLTSKGYVLNIPCYYDTGADTTAVTVSAFTTASADYIRIYTPTNTSTEVNQSQRHNGKWDTGKWRMEVDSSRAIDDNNANNDYVKIDGLQFKLSGTTAQATAIYDEPSASPSVMYVTNCIFKGGSVSGSNAIRAFVQTTNTSYLYNNIFYGFVNGTTNSYGIYIVTGTSYAYNNTSVNNYYGIDRDGGTAVAKNNLSYNNTTDYYGTFDTSSTNNLSKDATAPAYGTYYANATVKFVNSSKYDYHLDYNDTAAKGYGKNLSNDANLAITTDIDGQTRPSATSSGMWDIGADQTEKSVRIISTPPPANQNFGSAIPVFYSVGQNTSDHKTGSPTITITGTANATSTWQATFSQPQTARNLGVGDVITYGNTGKAYISGKITTMQWNVITATGTQVAATSSSPVNSVAHAFSSLEGTVDANTSNGAFDSSHLNTKDLTAKGYVVNIPCYYDTGADTTQVTVQSWTTSATSYIRIYTPTNTSTEVNQSQRHNGKWDTGKYRLESSGATIAIISVQIPNVKIDGLQVKASQSDGSSWVDGIDSTGASVTNNYFSNNIIKAGTLLGNVSNAGIDNWNSASTLYIWNNIIYGFKYSSGTAGQSGINIDSGTEYVYNNTIYNCYNGIYSSGGTIIVKNNLAYNNANTDYTGTFDSSSTNNLSKDATAPAYGTYYANATVKFVNSSKYDYHLDYNDNAAKGYGKNLSSDANLSFTTDIDGQTRPAATSSGMWDIGADQTIKVVKIKH